MLTLPPSVRVYLASRPIDMRCGHDGLMAIVRNVWAMDPYTGHLFAFVGMRRDRQQIAVVIYALHSTSRSRLRMARVRERSEGSTHDGPSRA